MSKDIVNTGTVGNVLPAIKLNDELVLRTFYRNNFAKVERYVLNNHGTNDEAKDIYQEAFIAVRRNIQLDRFRLHDEPSLEGYLYQVAKNKWLDQLRAAKRRQVVTLAEPGELADADPSKGYEDHLLDGIKLNLRLLGDNCRDVLERFYYNKESMRSIAAVMKWTEATARNNKYRCIQRLRELMQTKEKK